MNRLKHRGPVEEGPAPIFKNFDDFDDDIVGLDTEELAIFHELVIARLFDMEHKQRDAENHLPDKEFRAKQEKLVLMESRLRKALAVE